MYGITTNLDLDVHHDRDRALPANRRSVARKAAREQRFEEHTIMNYDPTVQYMIAAKAHAETLAKAERARIIAEARTRRPSVIIRARRFTGAMLVRAGERLQGANRSGSEQTASAVTGNALRLSR